MVPAQSELAQEMLKDPYVFDFIPYKEKLVEREIEKALIENIAKLLLEFGSGFAFMGNQYHLEIGGKDYFLDMLFYNVKLRCYFVVELKAGEFIPEFAGKLNFYLSAVDQLLKSDTDNPSIGLLLCKEKNKVIAEYALKDMSKPIGISEYQLQQYLPETIGKILPSLMDIESRINRLTEE